MDAFWTRQWGKELVHTAFLERVTSRDENSRPVYGLPTAIRCQVEDLSLARIFAAQDRGVSLNYEVLVAGNEEIGNDDRLTQAMDRWGNSLFPSAIVVRVVNYDHPRHGRVSRVAYCQLQ